MARLVIVSNRVPIPKARGAAAGGLAIALRDLLTPGSMWFGWSGRLTSEPAAQPSLPDTSGCLRQFGESAGHLSRTWM